MPTISENSSLFIEIVVFTLEPKQQQELVDAIVSEVERWVRHRPGFVSSNFHLSLDGTKVVNYAQWTTKEAWEGFTQDPEISVLSDKIKRVGVKPDGHSYKVYRAIEASST